MLKKLAVGISDFPTMILENYLYIDKTAIIYELYQEQRGRKYYFFSRPRRFGKSLLVSTLKELFLGNKKLFENLLIGRSDWNWQEHPVIYLDFSVIAHSSLKELDEALIWRLNKIAKHYNIDLSAAPTPTIKFADLIEQLAERNKVVVLIDEYDKPILDHIKDIKKADEMRDALKSFYDVLKGVDAYLRAIFVTGVTKFSKTSLFSGLNNLDDLTIDPRAAQLVGYTEEEITANLTPFIDELAYERESAVDELRMQMKTWYNGYKFSEINTKVYNPFSLIQLFNKKKFSNFWYETGTPTFLIHLIKTQYKDIEQVKTREMSAHSLGNFSLDNIPLVPLLFQTGYLTLAAYDKDTDKFTLGYPNFEIEESFTKFLVAALTDTNRVVVENIAMKLLETLKNCNLESFCAILCQLYAHIPYTLHIEKESYYHSLFQFLMSLLAIESQSEILTNRGRIDNTIFMYDMVYLIEMKFNEIPEKALAQIENKKYYERFLGKYKKIILVGLSFMAKPNFTINYVMREID